MSKAQAAKSANVQNFSYGGTMVSERLRRATFQFASSIWESRDEEVRAKEQPKAAGCAAAIRGGNYEMHDFAIRNQARTICSTIDIISAVCPDRGRPIPLRRHRFGHAGRNRRRRQQH